jgi:hypothetical protein
VTVRGAVTVLETVRGAVTVLELEAADAMLGRTRPNAKVIIHSTIEIMRRSINRNGVDAVDAMLGRMRALSSVPTTLKAFSTGHRGNLFAH